MALTKEQKEEAITRYEGWIKDSEGLVLTSNSGLSMADLDELRQAIRDAGGEFHIIKNTLAKLAFANAGLDVPQDYFLDTTALGIAFEDPPGVAKAIAEFEKNSDFLKIKGGFLGSQHMDAAGIKAMANLPPLPVVRGQLLGTIMAPASKIARTLAEPGRQLAQVVKAYSENEAAVTAA